MRRFALAAVVTVGGFAVAAACADPYDGEQVGTPAPERDATVPDDSAVDVSPQGDASFDAADAKADVDPCTDRDKDGFLARECDGGSDCDDDDNRAYPDAGFRTDPATLTTKGDWNCDGKYNRELMPNVSCAQRTGGTIGNNCDGVEGFVGDPACGAQGVYVKCKTSGVSACVEGSSEPRVQGCK